MKCFISSWQSFSDSMTPPNFMVISLNPPMAKEEEGGGGGVDATPTDFSTFSQKWEELFLQTKFLPAGSSLGHLSRKKFFRSDLKSWF